MPRGTARRIMRKPICIEAAAFQLVGFGRWRLPVVTCLAAFAVLAAGCAKSTRRATNPCEDCIILPRGVCAGYYPTCWRLWPSECPTCPLASEQPATPTSAPLPMPGESLPVGPTREETMPVPPRPLDGAAPTGAPQLPPAESPPTGAAGLPAGRNQAAPDSSQVPRNREVRHRSVVHRGAGRAQPSPNRAAQ